MIRISNIEIYCENMLIMFCGYFIMFTTAIIFLTPTSHHDNYECIVSNGNTVRYTLGTGRYTKSHISNTCLNETVTCDDVETTGNTASFAIIIDGVDIPYISNQSQILNRDNISLAVKEILFRHDNCYYLQVVGPATIKHIVV